MYSTASLPSRRPRKRHLFSPKNREWSASIADMSDFPGAASTRNREPSLSSIRLYPCPLRAVPRQHKGILNHSKIILANIKARRK
ncbi:hypothetical protein ECG_07592 [Echinococcus granulosus]|uniref:Uncharacterized protein n=1 Tax=Echinococcus granulosus TaxID=6210 RepID=A0A068X2D1_ECHGR|nr:hypothetical protein ECG_07592 [Echinococcus granulosus]CDS24143.1 hypothetical protein EgrG_000263900 [Echinococcus granulosus]